MEQIDKYPCVNAMVTPTESLDYYIKNNKLYRLKLVRQSTNDRTELNKIIDTLTIDYEYVLEKSSYNYVLLKQTGSEDTVEIITMKDENNNVYFGVYYYQPDIVDCF